MQPMQSFQGTITKELLSQSTNQSTLPSPVRSVWGSGLSSKIKSQQPIVTPAQPTVKADGSMHPPMTLTKSNYTGVVSLLIVNAAGDQILLINDQSADQSTSQIDINWEWPTELIESGSSIHSTIVKALQSISFTSDQSISQSKRAHLVAVEHYPTLATQWIRYSYIIQLDDDQEIQQSIEQSISASKMKLFSIKDLIDEKISINQSNLITVLQEIFNETTTQLDWHKFVPLNQSVNQASKLDSAHISISVALTLNDHLLMLTSSQSGAHLPSTHCDKGETLTFTVDRLARARFGLVQLSGTSIVHVHHSVKSSSSSGEGVHVVLHADLSDAKLDSDLKNAPHTLAPSQLSSDFLSSMPDVLKPLKSNNTFTFIPLSDVDQFDVELQPLVSLLQSRVQSINQSVDSSSTPSSSSDATAEKSTAEASSDDQSKKQPNKPSIGVPVIHVKPQSN